MKISPIMAPTNSVSAQDPQIGRVESVRSLRMNVNRTPLDGPPSDNTQETPILDDNKAAQESSVEDTQPISPQFAALAREKRAIQVRKRELDEREKALEAKSQGSDVVPLARLKSEPLRVLLESGVTYEQLTEAIIANQGNPEVSALKAELNAVKEGLDKKLSDRETHEEQQLYREVGRDVQRLVASRPDDFELVKKMGREPIAVEIWKREFKETGEYPDMESILRDVEEHSLKECQEFTSVKKIQSLFAPAPQVQPQQRSQGMRTLTNKDTASVPLGRRERALAAAFGTLKK